MANLGLLNFGVQLAKKTLFVFCDDSIMNTIPTLTDLNSEVYDLCLLNNKPMLDCIILNKFQNQIPKTAHFVTPPSSVVTKLLTPSISKKQIDIEDKLDEVLFGQPFRLFKSVENFCKKRYSFVVIGGTFDRFHGGHKQLLSAALLICDKTLVVGVTSEKMFKTKKNSSKIQSITLRKRLVLQFCKSFEPNVEIELHEINDPFGPSIVDKRLEAIVVSSETLKGARLVNEKRIQNKIKQLDCIAVRRTNAYTLSSTFLRNLEDSPKL